MSTRFWLATFEKNNVYDNLAGVLKTGVEKRTVEKGGNRGDAAFLTNLATASNLKDVTEKNLTNILSFLNGESKELNVYIPINKIPKGLLPKNIKPISETMTIEELLKQFNIMGIQNAQIKNLASVGSWSTYFWVLNMALIGLIVFLLIRLTDHRSKFIASGAAFILSGILVFALSAFGYAVRGSMLTDWVKGSEPTQVLLAPFAPYILGEVLKMWFFAGIALLTSGGVLLVLRKKQK